ncbi:Methyltransferase ptaH [Pseudocercospora fuligena]|uniref:Methyltransferase ptaH n=1 Tax=Pseudocercospora fuligena TaxID=685502 RepID=A0A8H6VS61_9PEZI|nr:Methyltransferase ptaH [Pseudocercospora fuligena]
MAPIANWYDHNKSFWDAYHTGRPKIPDSFFERVYEYHTSHGGRLDLAHEPGAGLGIHSLRLAGKFSRVLITDPSDQNIDTIKQRLLDATTNGGDRLEIHKAKLEDIPSTLPQTHGKIDLIFCATMLHWTSIIPAMDSISSQLVSPGGTFIAFNSGVLHLYDEKINEIWKPIIPSETTKFFRSKYDAYPTPEEKKALIGWAMVGRSAYDSVPLDPDLFTDVQRIKLNYDTPGFDLRTATIGNFVDDIFPLDLKPYSKVREGEKVASEMCPEGWEFEGGIKELRAVAETFPIEKEGENFKKRWAELEKVVGDDKVKGVWPVTLIMATRK